MVDIITSDWHLSDNPRDEYRFDFFERRLPGLLTRQNADTLYVLGDLSEAKDQHRSALVNRVARGFAQLAEQCHVVLLRGNHDGPTDDSPFWRFLSNTANIDFISGPLVHGDILFLPHSRNPERDWAPFVGAPNIALILAHNTFSGAIGANDAPLTGVAPPSRTIPIISGDVHVPQQTGNVTYVGAPYSINFGDNYPPRLLIRRGDTITSMRLRGPRKLVIRPGQGGASPGDIVRIEVALNTEDYARWPELREQARAWGIEAGLIVDSVIPLVPSIGLERVAAEVVVRTDPELLKEYCDRFSIDKHTAKIGMELL